MPEVCTCGCKNIMCLASPCMCFRKSNVHLCFAYMHSYLASQTSTVQNLVRQCLSIVQEDGCELFLLFGCCFCSTWSWLAGVLGVWSLDQCLVLKQLELCCRGHVSFSHMHIILPSCIQTKFGSILYVDRRMDWTQDVSVDPLFVCASRIENWDPPDWVQHPCFIISDPQNDSSYKVAPCVCPIKVPSCFLFTGQFMRLPTTSLEI